jgi:glutamine amidotransferase
MFKEDKRENIIMVASEPLTFEKGESDRVSYFCFPVTDLLSADWMEIKTNNMIVLTPKMNVLLIPIIDKFYVHPSDPESQNRGTDFAAAKGLFSERWQVNIPGAPAPDSTTPQQVSPV